MPSVQMLGGMVLVLTLGMSASAAPLPILYTATVKVPEAEVRSGPSSDPQMYPTNRLRQGAVVEVVEEKEGGWLGIKPPPGSFSWISTRPLKRLSTYTWAVNTRETVPVLLGSELVNQKPTVAGRQVGFGNLVVAIGSEKTADDGTYLPIEPPEGELRYVRAEAVTKNLVPGETARTLTVAAPPSMPSPSAAPVPEAPPPPTGSFAQPRGAVPAVPLPTASAAPELAADPQWNEAQELERAGRTAEAERAYTELGKRLSADPAKHDLAMQCFNRAYFLRQPNQGAAVAAEARYAGQGADGRLRPVAGVPYRPQGNCATPCPPAQQSNPVPAVNVPVLTSEPGMLRRASRAIDSRPTYMLRSSNGFLLAYVTAEPGVDLESHLDQVVTVQGPTVYRSDVRATYITVQRVVVPPQ
jgi:hypothetical protein